MAKIATLYALYYTNKHSEFILCICTMIGLDSDMYTRVS